MIKLTAVIKRKCVFVYHTDFSAPKSQNSFDAVAAPAAAAAAAAASAAAFVNVVVITVLRHV